MEVMKFDDNVNAMLKKMFVIVKALRGLTVQCLAESCRYRYFKIKIPPSNSQSQIDDDLYHLENAVC